MKTVNNLLKLLLIVVLLILQSCQNPEVVDYSFFVAGHVYGKPGRNEMGLWPPFKEKFDYLNKIDSLKFGVLTGDVVRHANKDSWDAVDSDLKQIKAPVYFARGNHDGGLKFIEKRYGKTYRAFIIKGDLHIILDTNLAEWNIEGEQLAFLKEKINTENIANIFIYFHHLMWFTEKEYRVPYINSRDRMSDTLTFWPKLFPLFKATEKPVFLFAGDVGVFNHPNPIYQSYSYIKKDNITMITSGMGGGKKDNFIIVDVLKNKKVKFRLIHLNGDDIKGLGELEDYKRYIKPKK